MMRITGQDALDLLRKVVIGKEDYIYRGHRVSNNMINRCVYARKEEDEYVPDCIIGHILPLLGVSLERVYWSSCANMTRFRSLIRDELTEFEFTDLAVTVLMVAQDNQDLGMRWGDILKTVERRFTTLSG